MKERIIRSGLPENITEMCDYVGQTMNTTDLSHCNVNPDEPLIAPVDTVRWNYPFHVETGSYNVCRIRETKTWGQLLTEIVKTFQREYAKDESVHFHTLADYIIEPIQIHPGGLATVMFGS